jgi:hypothetical protein
MLPALFVKKPIRVSGIEASQFSSSFFGRISGASRRKPGYPLQSFLPGTAKKYFRFYPLRFPSGAICYRGGLIQW